MRKPIIWITSIAGAAALIAGGTAVAVAANTTNTFAPLAVPASTSSASAVPSDLAGAIAAAQAEVGPGTVIDADTDDNANYAYEIDLLLDSGGVVEVKLDRSLKVISTQNDDRTDDQSDDRSDDSRNGSADDDAVPDAAAVERASEAALAHVGSGTVVSVEYSDDNDHLYEVEIDLADREDIDVELDAQFSVVKAD